MEDHHQTINPSSETIIIAALSTLSPSLLTQLTHHLSSVFHHHTRRVSALLSSPTLFSLTLHHLHTLSLHHKSLLISRHLLSNLSILANFMQQQHIPLLLLPPPRSATAMKLRDLDVVLLLLLLCELHHHDAEALDSPPSRWRVALCRHAAENALKLSNMGVSNSEVLIKYIELVAKCKNFVNAIGYGGGGGARKDGREVAAAVAAVVALPSVEVRGRGWECVICKEEMREGRDVCELPCQHLFHWICILPWLKKRNTCPCCRFNLPTDDVSAEIQRLWMIFAKICGGA